MKLFTYFRSSAAYRLRIALALKGIDADSIPVHLRRGVHTMPDYAAINPQRLIPALIDGPDTLTQSLAIIEYLEEVHPQPPLLPLKAVERARVRALALAVACDIHPLNNLRVLNFLRSEMGQDDAGIVNWSVHWIMEGFGALEALLADSDHTGLYCHGGTPGLADTCLVPQVFNALRVGCDLEPYPTIRRIYDTCMAHAAFRDTAPENQPDAEL